MSNLATLYFHIDIETTENEKQNLKEYLENNIKNISKVIFKQEVGIHIEIENGSIKTFLVILGSLYIGIGHYGSFRAGIDQLIKDSKIMQKIIFNDLNKNGIDEDRILVNKRLVAAPDKIRKIFIKIDKLEENYNKNSMDDNKKEIQKIIYMLENVLNQIDNETDFELIKNGIKSEYLPNFNFLKYNHSSSNSYEIKNLNNEIPSLEWNTILARDSIPYKREDDYLLLPKNDK